MNKVICIGSACKDIFFPTSEGKIISTPEDLLSRKKIEFELGAKYKIEQRFESLGGCAANVASGLSRLEIETACYSHIGDDHIAEWTKKELKKNRIDISLITQENNCPSDLSAIIIDKDSADRVIFSNQKANGFLNIIPKKIKDTEWYFVGDLHGDWENHLKKIWNSSRENNVKIAYNPRQANIHDNVKIIIEYIAKTDILFLNKDESIEVIKGLENHFYDKELNDEKFLIKKLRELGAKIAIITDGERGAWAYQGKEFFFMPGRKVGAIDSTGAGDSFASAFLGAYIKGRSMEECLQWGIANSSSVIQFYGAIEGLLDEKLMTEIIANF
jgi:ribokinase